MVILIVASYFFRWVMFGSPMVRRLGTILRSVNCSGFYTKLSVGLGIGWEMLFIVSSLFFRWIFFGSALGRRWVNMIFYDATSLSTARSLFVMQLGIHLGSFSGNKIWEIFQFFFGDKIFAICEKNFFWWKIFFKNIEIFFQNFKIFFGHFWHHPGFFSKFPTFYGHFVPCSRASFSAVCGPISTRFRAWGTHCSYASIRITLLGLGALFGHEFCGLRRVVSGFRFCGPAATLALLDAWFLALRPRMGGAITGGALGARLPEMSMLLEEIRAIRARKDDNGYEGMEAVKTALRAVLPQEVLDDSARCDFACLRACAPLFNRTASGQGRNYQRLHAELACDLYGRPVPEHLAEPAPPQPEQDGGRLGTGAVSALVLSARNLQGSPGTSSAAGAAAASVGRSMGGPPEEVATVTTANPGVLPRGRPQPAAVSVSPVDASSAAPEQRAPAAAFQRPSGASTSARPQFSAGPVGGSGAAPNPSASVSARRPAAGAPGAGDRLSFSAVPDNAGGVATEWRAPESLRWTPAGSYDGHAGSFRRLSPMGHDEAAAPSSLSVPARGPGRLPPSYRTHGAPVAQEAPAWGLRGGVHQQWELHQQWEFQQQRELQQQQELQQQRELQHQRELHYQRELLRQQALQQEQQAYMAHLMERQEEQHQMLQTLLRREGPPPAPTPAPGPTRPPQAVVEDLLMARSQGLSPAPPGSAGPPAAAPPQAPRNQPRGPAPTPRGNGWGAPGGLAPARATPIPMSWPNNERQGATLYTHMVSNWGSAEKFARKVDLAGTANSYKRNAITMGRAVDALVRNDGVDPGTSDAVELLVRRLMAMAWAKKHGKWDVAQYFEEEGVAADPHDGTRGLPAPVRRGAVQVANAHRALDGAASLDVAMLLNAQLALAMEGKQE